MSELGTPEWMQSMIQQTSEKAAMRLEEIIEMTLGSHGIAAGEAPRLIVLMKDVQDLTFQLGVSMGIQMSLDALGRRRR